MGLRSEACFGLLTFGRGTTILVFQASGKIECVSELLYILNTLFENEMMMRIYRG